MKLKEKKQIGNYKWYIGASFYGIIFLILGIFLCINTFNYKNVIETTGIIDEIYKDNKNKYVYVAYIVNGKEYRSILNANSPSFREGKKIKVYYDKENPELISTKTTDLLIIFVPSAGLILILIGITGLINSSKKAKNKKYLKENGTLIYANYEYININNKISKRYNRHPCNIICKWTDPIDNQSYIFKSDDIWIYIGKMINLINKYNIKQFPVYINPDNKKDYYVDIEILNGYDINDIECQFDFSDYLHEVSQKIKESK